MSLHMVCNFRKCRKSLTNKAWVTICSHAFCVEHGKREFRSNTENSLICPACGTELHDKFDVIEADLNPSETFKSIVLAGMKPDTIMDIAMRSMSFWSYQVEQETLYQETLAKHSTEKLQCLEEVNTLNLQKLKAEMDTCKRKILSLQTEFNNKRKQIDEMTARLEDKTRKIQKLTFELEKYKRKDLHVDREFVHKVRSRNNSMNVSKVMDRRHVTERFVFRPAKESEPLQSISSSISPVFNFHSRRPERNNFNFRPVT